MFYQKKKSVSNKLPLGVKPGRTYPVPMNRNVVAGAIYDRSAEKERTGREGGPDGSGMIAFPIEMLERMIAERKAQVAAAIENGEKSDGRPLDVYIDMRAWTNQREKDGLVYLRVEGHELEKKPAPVFDDSEIPF